MMIVVFLNTRFDYVCEGFLCSIGSGDFHIEKECDRALQVSPSS